MHSLPWFLTSVMSLHTSTFPHFLLSLPCVSWPQFYHLHILQYWLGNNHPIAASHLRTVSLLSPLLLILTSVMFVITPFPLTGYTAYVVVTALHSLPHIPLSQCHCQYPLHVFAFITSCPHVSHVHVNTFFSLSGHCIYFTYTIFLLLISWLHWLPHFLSYHWNCLMCSHVLIVQCSCQRQQL